MNGENSPKCNTSVKIAEINEVSSYGKSRFAVTTQVFCSLVLFGLLIWHMCQEVKIHHMEYHLKDMQNELANVKNCLQPQVGLGEKYKEEHHDDLKNRNWSVGKTGDAVLRIKREANMERKTEGLKKRKRGKPKRRKPQKPSVHLVACCESLSNQTSCSGTLDGPITWKAPTEEFGFVKGSPLVTFSTLGGNRCVNKIEVGVTGTYHVYAQVTYNGLDRSPFNRNGSELLKHPSCSHQTKLKFRREDILLMYGNVAQINFGQNLGNDQRRRSTHPFDSVYHGGVFYLMAGSMIYVQLDHHSHNCRVAMHPEKTFAGLYLVQPG